MVPPRFMFVSRRLASIPSSAAWPRAWTVDDAGGAPRAGWTAWRLLGSNNRELGRSFTVFADLDACIASLEEFRASASTGVALVAADPRNGSWGWRLDVAARPMAASGRAYRRQRECHYNLGQFTAALPTAVVSVPSARADAS